MISPKRFVFIIGLVLFVFILLQAELSRVLEIFSSMDFAFFSASLLVLAFMLLLKGVKWKLVLESQGEKLPALKASKYFCIGFFFSSVTPARLGDFARALYLKGASLPLALSSIVLDRLIDVSLLVCFSILASAGLASFYGVTVLPGVVLFSLVVLIAAAFFFLFRESYLKLILRPIFRFVVPHPHREKFSVGFTQFFSSVKLVWKKPVPFVLAISFGAVFWAAAVFFSQLLALSLHIPVPIEMMFLIYPIVTLGDLLPISVSGLGTREAIVAFFFSSLSLPLEAAVAFSLLLFFSGYVLVALLGYLFFVSEPVELNTLLGEN